MMEFRTAFSSQAWIIGFIIITLSSYTRFNIPQTSRSSTTWGRYHAVAFIYTAVTVAGWLILANTPDILGYLGIQANLDQQVRQLAVPLYAALVLTALVSSFKPFQEADEKLRTFFQGLASIPWEAQRLSVALRDNKKNIWLPTSALQDQVRTNLRNADFSDANISFSDNGTPQALWTKISTLYYYINKWQGGEQRRFAAFYYKHLTEFKMLSDNYDVLATRARTLFRLLDTFHLMPNVNLLEVQNELIRSFSSEAKRLEKDICDLASQALLKCALTEKTRQQELESMGFVVNVSPNPIFDRLLLLYVILTMLYMVTLWLAKRPWPGMTGVMIGTNYVGAVGIAIYLKQWPWAHPTEAVRRPIRSYLLSGILAFVFAIVISCSMAILRTWDVKHAVPLIERVSSWSLMAACIAVVTAYNIDNDERSTRRWIEATLQAVSCMAIALVIYIKLTELCDKTVDTSCTVPSLVRLTLLAAASGGLIGWLVPTWFRECRIMTDNYKHCRIIVTAKVSSNGEVTPRIWVLHSSEQGYRYNADTQGSLLPFEEKFSSVDEALIRAIKYARKQIDVDLESVFEKSGSSNSGQKQLY